MACHLKQCWEKEQRMHMSEMGEGGETSSHQCPKVIWELFTAKSLSQGRYEKIVLVSKLY